MNLSKRLKAVADLTEESSRVIDVGCDHGYLDIYLCLNKNCDCLATDINKNALASAKNNILKYGLTSKIDTCLTDGLKGLKIDKTDIIVICGMGTHTIIDILNSNTLSDTLIISSNNDIPLLRKSVINLGFYISDELFVVDKNKPYVIIKFQKGSKKYSYIDYEVGPILKYNSFYVDNLIIKYKKIYNKINHKKIFLKIKYYILIKRLKKLKTDYKSENII